MRVYEHLLAMDAALVAKGFPPLSPWWRETFRAFFAARASGRRLRRLVARVARRGGKSSSLSRLAVAVALFGDFKIPPGDVGVVAFISVSRDEAAQRLRTIRAILDALGVVYSERGDAIELADRPVLFKVFTASIAGISGPTCILVIGDECAKWKDSDTGANPAKEVIATAGPTMATQPAAFAVWSSSCFSTLDAHHEMFTRGNTDDQMVAAATTWEANPTISEDETHALEPDVETWRREYGNEPMGSGASAFFDADAIDAAVDADLFVPCERPAGAVCAAGTDPAFKRDAAVVAVVANLHDVFTLVALEERRPAKGAPLKPSEVGAAFAQLARSFGCASIMSDGHYAESLREAVSAHGLTLNEIPGGVEGKTSVYVRARELLNTGRLRLPGNVPTLVRSLKEIVSKPTAAGQLAITQPRRSGNHGDTASALVAALWATTGGGIPMSEIGPIEPEDDRWAGCPARGF